MLPEALSSILALGKKKEKKKEIKTWRCSSFIQKNGYFRVSQLKDIYIRSNYLLITDNTNQPQVGVPPQSHQNLFPVPRALLFSSPRVNVLSLSAEALSRLLLRCA